VAVLIPTCGEPPSMVALTIESVLDQNWPQDRLVIIVGDDAHSDEMAEAVYDVAERFPASSIIYHEPRGAVTHAGEATPRRGTSILAMSCSRPVTTSTGLRPETPTTRSDLRTSSTTALVS